MIYSNIRIVTKGPLGTIKDYNFNPPATPETDEQDDTPQAVDPAVFLGEFDGRVYRYFPDSYDITQSGEQPAEIDFKLESELSEDARLSLREQARANFQKRLARKEIERDVGDVLDLIADLGQLIEFAVIAVSALWADKAKLATLEESTVQDYGQRGAAVLQAVQSGELTLRSSFEAPEKMINTIMPRYAKVQQIVRDRYITPLKELGL